MNKKKTIDLAFKKEKKRGNKILINKAKCIIVAKLGENVTGKFLELYYNILYI